MPLPDYKKLGHRFKKRRLSSNIRALIASRKLDKHDRRIHSNTCVIVRLDHIGDYLLFRNFLQETVCKQAIIASDMKTDTNNIQ